MPFLFSGCDPWAEYTDFLVWNKTSQTLLVSFYDGETEIFNLTKLDSNKAQRIQTFDPKEFKDTDAAFCTLWHNFESEFRVYSADTVLLRTWKPSFDSQSSQKEFYRKYDWYEEQSTETTTFYFQITDSDLPPIGSVSAQ